MIPDDWRAFRRRHLSACWGLLGLPAAVGLAIVLRTWFGVASTVPFVALATGWAVWWGVTALRAVRAPCPRCGTPFLAGQEPEFRLVRACARCGLGLYHPVTTVHEATQPPQA